MGKTTKRLVWAGYRYDPELSCKRFMAAYEKTLRKQDYSLYTLVGRWLETLAVDYGIHPWEARRRLEALRERGILDYKTHGAPTAPHFEQHYMAALGDGVQAPFFTLRKIHLYHGDFLIPGKRSVGLRLERNGL